MSLAPLLILSVCLAVAGQVLLKSAMTRVGHVGSEDLKRPAALVLRLVSSPMLWLGYGVYLAAAVSWIFVLTRAELSFAYPFLGLSYVGVSVVAVFGLGEKLCWRQWVGVAFILLGVVVVGSAT